MIIREEQMRAFEESLFRGFEDRMIERVRSYFPKSAEQIGEAQLRVLTGYAVKRAKRHGMTHERSVGLYLDLMLVLGSNFDEDSQFPWVGAILSDTSSPSQADRIDRLHREGWQYGQTIEFDLQRPAGHGSRVMEAIADIARKSAETASSEQLQAAGNEVAARLQTLFPVKCGVIGGERLRGLVNQAIEKSSQDGMASARGVWLFSVLMFLLGAGFDSDPQFPWAQKALAEGMKLDGPAAANRLYSEARGALMRWWGADAAVQV